MTDEEVINFVNNYMPAYELYLGHLRASIVQTGNGKSRKQLRLVINKERHLVHSDSSQVVEE